jgi:hypothetical protein
MDHRTPQDPTLILTYIIHRQFEDSKMNESISQSVNAVAVKHDTRQDNSIRFKSLLHVHDCIVFSYRCCCIHK